MKHLDDGRLQAFLDDELVVRDRADAAEHLLACAECRGARDDLVRANAVFSEAVALLDSEASGRSAPSAGGVGRLGGGSLVKAAGLVLFLAAAASAAVPGSPVREWFVQAAGPSADAAPVAEMAPVEAAPVIPRAPMGVSLGGAEVTVVLMGLDGVTVRLEETDGERVTVTALGTESDPVFSTAPGRIEVRGGVGGAVTIGLPRSLPSGRVVMDGEVCAVKDGGELELRGGPETVAGVAIWR